MIQQDMPTSSLYRSLRNTAFGSLRVSLMRLLNRGLHCSFSSVIILYGSRFTDLIEPAPWGDCIVWISTSQCTYTLNYAIHALPFVTLENLAADGQLEEIVK